ncbi:MAG: hypothetical protein JAZ03_13170, partial [Candidatus Thiodiazotropha taylori]|nr:hypothetical protein [Candidatus Thiodiazotropha taylori]MCW4334883.1 hypothetical protein [Candidatus Thiodiazotropha endolucinida]
KVPTQKNVAHTFKNNNGSSDDDNSDDDNDQQQQQQLLLLQLLLLGEMKTFETNKETHFYLYI